MNKIHLICNSHLDPVWMWDWDEGLGEAISTFWQAEQFCKEFDYIFNHNEAVLYEYIEEHDPELFAAIQGQVKAGKWHIMGGWYLQPDCNMPSGEAFIRQIALGRKYFQKKFNARPTTAINFDSFGHSVGMVQILKKCGYDSYLFCRPMPEVMQLPDREFIWVGKDGSRIKASRYEDLDLYCSQRGQARADIERKVANCDNAESGVVLWGVGNHGGVPSHKDLTEVTEYINQNPIETIHSTPEAYFADIHPTDEVSRSLRVFVGAYTSMQSVKQKHIELENTLFTTEKLCSYAQLNGLYEPNQAVFTRAEKALAALQFHDILAGTCGPDGEKSSLRRCDCALELLQEEFNKAFIAICSQHTRATPGEFPIFIYNSQPFAVKQVCETEILMPKPVISETEQYTVTAYLNGEALPTQCIKELTNINYDRRKRIVYRCELAPFGVTRVDFRVEVTLKQTISETTGEDIEYSDSCKTLRISRKTGLLESYVVNGKELLSGGAFQPVILNDNADPWGWYMDVIGTEPEAFNLSQCQYGPFAGLKNVNMIEDGSVLTSVESFFESGSSYVRVLYKIYRDLPEIDITVDVLWNEQQKALKIKIPCDFDGRFLGQIPFGIEEYEKNGYENVAQRFVCMSCEDRALALYNSGTYGFSAMGNDLYATLLRGVAYAAHPIEDRPLIDEKRFIPTIEQGRHSFSFRLSWDKLEELENRAQAFVNTPYSLNFFPHGNGVAVKPVLELDNYAISLSAFYREEDHYVLRLVNNQNVTDEVFIRLEGQDHRLQFTPYEVKTMIYSDGSLSEKELWV